MQKFTPQVEEAIRDAAPYDISGTIRMHISERLPLLQERARLCGDEVVNRSLLCLVITGDETARNALAAAYAKALQGYGITSGREDAEEPVVKSVQWLDIISNHTGNPTLAGVALDKLYGANMEARGGVLVIENIYDRPKNSFLEEKVTSAQNGAYRVIHELMTDFAGDEETPAIILAGQADKMAAFLSATPEIAGYFTAPHVAASTPLPTFAAPQADSTMTIYKPLKLKAGPG